MNKRKFVLRLKEETMKSVEKWAADEFRSINGQLEWIITQALRDQRRLKEKKNTTKKSNDGIKTGH